MFATSTLSPTPVPVPFPYSPELPSGFLTIDGYVVAREEGETALRNGTAVLVGGLLVVFFPI